MKTIKKGTVMTIDFFEEKVFEVINMNFCISINAEYKEKTMSVSAQDGNVFSTTASTYDDCYRAILKQLDGCYISKKRIV